MASWRRAGAPSVSVPPVRWNPLLHATSVPTASYHAVHGEVVVLRLQLHRVGMAGPDLSVAVQKQALVVCDPVEHLPE